MATPAQNPPTICPRLPGQKREADQSIAQFCAGTADKADSDAVSPCPATRRCKVCGRTKAISQFDLFDRERDYRSRVCKSCRRAHQRSPKYRARRAADYRRWRQERPKVVAANLRRYAERHPERARARSDFRYAVRTGRIQRPDACALCGAIGPVDGHHSDYTKPLQPTWLCRSCHLKVHSAMRLLEATAKKATHDEGNDDE